MKTEELNIRMDQVENKSAKQGKLADDELDQVIGGSNVRPKPAATIMKCSNCGYNMIWQGRFEGQTFTCPGCHQNTFKGERLI